jgi:hypothetical protein
MLTQHDYKNLDTAEWEKDVLECCSKDDQENPGGCDCCYDSWVEELKEVNTKYNDVEEESRQIASSLTVILDRRDKLKSWYDELTKANDASRKICDQIDVFLCHIEKVSKNTMYTVKAIKVLYCMVKDFYMQIDVLKTKYEELINCIRCLNDPSLAPGQGVMKCIEDYGKKLEAVIATRDVLIELLMKAIHTAFLINKNLGKDHGLYTIIEEWKVTFNCDEPCPPKPDCEPGAKSYPVQHGQHGHAQHTTVDTAETCDLEPVFQFPICSDPYYDEIRDRYESDRTKANELSDQLRDLNKKKESLLACKQSLQTAIAEVDPKTRCK